MKHLKLPKVLTAAIALTLVFSTACNININSTEEETEDSTGTPETTEVPVEDTDELFPRGDKEFFTPFADPEHSYCSINECYGVPVREQGKGGCYSYASVSAIQTNYLMVHGKLIDLNPVDIINRIYEVPETGEDGEMVFDDEKYYVYNASVTDLGGGYDQVTGAMCADPLNGYLISETNVIGCYNCEVSGIYEVSEDEVKDAIKNFGAVCLTVNYKKDCKMVNGYYTQNYADNATDVDHVAVIVGWDDNFPAEGFKTPASRDGAWLVQNSFGTYWGNMGFYWVSFDMAIPALYTMSVTRDYKFGVSYGRYDQVILPSSDLIEIAAQNEDPDHVTADRINSCNNVTYASVYNKSGTIGAIGFWTEVPGQNYEIQVLDGEFGEVLATVSGSFEYAGYHTVELDEHLHVKNFTVVVKTPGTGYFEGESEECTVWSLTNKHAAHYEAKTAPGRSFIEIDGKWVDVTEPDIISQLGLDDLPGSEGFDSIGDPCITVLYL